MIRLNLSKKNGSVCGTQIAAAAMSTNNSKNLSGLKASTDDLFFFTKSI